MKRIPPFVLFALFGIQAFAADLDSVTAKELPSLVALYREFHAHPELSLHEEETAAKLAKELRSAGLEVTENVGAHGVVGILKNGEGPVILVRTELDALPVKEQTGLPYASKVTTRDDTDAEVPVMHACGHDIHMACLIGTARALSQLRDQCRGTLIMVGQSAEERVLGARMMLRAGLFSRFPKPDKALALHCAYDLPYGSVGMVEGYALANVDSMDIVVRGVGTHGSMPHLGRDPIVLAAQIVLALQTIVSREVMPGDPAVVTVGTIRGGTKRNIIPDEVRLQLTLRSYKDETRAKLIASVKRIAKSLAEAADMPADKMPVVTVSDESANALYNQPAFNREVRAAIEKGIGSERVLTREPVMGAEDFSEFGLTREKVPLCMFWLGTQSAESIAEERRRRRAWACRHSIPHFFKPVPEPTIETGVKER